MTYIDSLIKEIATDMCIREQKRTKFILGLFIGTFIGGLFWFGIFLELYILAPVR